MDYYELAEQTQVYPEWETVWIIHPEANPARSTGDTVCSARLVDAYTLECEMLVYDAIPTRTMEETRPFGTLKTVDYEIQQTGRRYAWVLREWAFRPALATLSTMASTFLHHSKHEIDSRRPNNRAPDGWSLDERSQRGKVFEWAAEPGRKRWDR